MSPSGTSLRLLDFGTYHTEWEELDSQPYPDAWAEMQRGDTRDARAGPTANVTLTMKDQADVIDDTMKTARRIVDALLIAGFQTSTPPNAETRIFVNGLVWRKRSPTG
jgi:hypothetical protein